MRFAERLSRIPPYLFAEIDRLIEEKKEEGVDVISLGIGDPDTPTPPHIVQAMRKAIEKPEHHQYPSYAGMPAFRQAVADWYSKHYGVELEPTTEIVSLIGAKEGIAHLALALAGPGDAVLCSDPGYPVYRMGPLLADAEPISLPLREANGFFPDFSEIPSDVARRATFMFLCYPNMPTAAVATKAQFEEALAFARSYDIIVCHDFAYSEIVFDGYQAPSMLQLDKTRTIELHSLSKTYNMTGWRVGFAAGNSDIIQALGKVKTNIDSGVFQAIQEAAIDALTGPQDCVEELRTLYRGRRDRVVACFRELGWPAKPPQATLYVWLPTPKGEPSQAFAQRLLEMSGVVVVPGVGYGEHGEGYFRISLTVPDGRLEEALQRVKKSGIRFAP